MINPKNNFVIVKELDLGEIEYWNAESQIFGDLEYCTVYETLHLAKTEVTETSGKVKQLTDEEQSIFED